MKQQKPKLFTKEFIDSCVLVLSMSIGGAVVVLYKDTLPLWAILAIGFWYPVGVAIKAIYRRIGGGL